MDDATHIPQLQEKLNDYLAFIESGEIYESYPDAHGREIEIQLICKYLPLEGEGSAFIEHAGDKIRGAGFHFRLCGLSEAT